MEIAFDAIGIELANEAAFDDLTKDVDENGEPSLLPRRSGVLHGRCLKLGEGLEVWSLFYESKTGEIFYADCRPGFRAKYAQKISPWVMAEFDEEGKAIIHGFIADTETEVLFGLQNLTEVGNQIFEQNALDVGLCGLAYRAEIIESGALQTSETLGKFVLNNAAGKNDWSLCGEVIAFSAVHNPFSGNDLYWIYLDLGQIKLELLVNQRAVRGTGLWVGATIRADIWLQGHVLDKIAPRSSYEGVDRTYRTNDFWKNFKKLN